MKYTPTYHKANRGEIGGLCSDCQCQGETEDNGVEHNSIVEFAWQACHNPNVTEDDNCPYGFWIWLAHGCIGFDKRIVTECDYYVEVARTGG